MFGPLFSELTAQVASTSRVFGTSMENNYVGCPHTNFPKFVKYSDVTMWRLLTSRNERTEQSLIGTSVKAVLNYFNNTGYYSLSMINSNSCERDNL